MMGEWLLWQMLLVPCLYPLSPPGCLLQLQGTTSIHSISSLPKHACLPAWRGVLSLSTGQARSTEGLGLQRPTFNKQEIKCVVAAPHALTLGCSDSEIRFPQPFSRPWAGLSPVVHSGSPLSDAPFTGSFPSLSCFPIPSPGLSEITSQIGYLYPNLLSQGSTFGKPICRDRWALQSDHMSLNPNFIAFCVTLGDLFKLLLPQFSHL